MCSLLSFYVVCFIFFFFKQKTAYEMRISDWSSDVCSSDLCPGDQRDSRSASSAGRSALARRRADRTRSGMKSRVAAPWRGHAPAEIGRASCRERVCQYVSISVVAVSLQKKTQLITDYNTHLLYQYRLLQNMCNYYNS